MKEKKFEMVSISSYSGHPMKKNYVIKNEYDWKDLWDTTTGIYTPKPKVPEINFSKEMIIAVYRGQCATGGYGVEIKKFIEKKKSIEVLVEEHFPKSGYMYTQAFTQPYHIVKTETTKKKVKFKRVKE